ncbi:unnamed protein product [Ambrosiozyma monospora]|uniref:Unnamed protein product n=1 Tax=Ambrosiozyma monospora TaxID=43982 RepID=A0ACB5TLX1_AMBMO|nr:unnamed protein product [Ambrosiozyma monospora]
MAVKSDSKDANADTSAKKLQVNKRRRPARRGASASSSKLESGSNTSSKAKTSTSSRVKKPRHETETKPVRRSSRRAKSKQLIQSLTTYGLSTSSSESEISFGERLEQQRNLRGKRRDGRRSKTTTSARSSDAKPRRRSSRRGKTT